MLRTGFKNTHKLQPPWRAFSTAGGQVRCAKNYNSGSSLRQGKILGKLFGDRVAGSKKRWFPTQDGSAANASATAVFKASQFGRSAIGGASGGGKGNTRRMTVLNKLFMKHITDLLATGEASEAILGRGLQVSRVKISPDFAGVNVYWQSGAGGGAGDALLEQELQRCSGRLRHELSQLALMGEVPRITFVREKSHSNLAQLEVLLRNMDFGTPEQADDTEDAQQRHSLVANTLKREFYGSKRSQMPVAETEPADGAENDWPEMRHDVLGLDHREIMCKIHAKMRKTKLAWEQLQNPQVATPTLNVKPAVVTTTAFATVGVVTSPERSSQKIGASSGDEAALKFEQFLAQRRKSANAMPERKRFRRTSAEWLTASDAELDEAAASVLSPQQRSRVYAEDYIEDDDVHEEKQSERERVDGGKL